MHYLAVFMIRIEIGWLITPSNILVDCMYGIIFFKGRRPCGFVNRRLVDGGGQRLGEEYSSPVSLIQSAFHVPYGVLQHNILLQFAAFIGRHIV